MVKDWAHSILGGRQRHARADFIGNLLIFSSLAWRCACRLPSCLLAANFAQKSVPKIGKICTILGAVPNLNDMNTLSAISRSSRDFSTKTPLSFLTTSHGTQWRSSKISEWLRQGKHAT